MSRGENNDYTCKYLVMKLQNSTEKMLLVARERRHFL